MRIRFCSTVNLTLYCFIEDEGDMSWERTFRRGEVHEVGEVSEISDLTSVLEFTRLGGYAELSIFWFVREEKILFLYDAGSPSLN